MIPLAVPNLAGREGDYLQECVTSTFVSTVGPFVSRFEDMVAESSAHGTPLPRLPGPLRSMQRLSYLAWDMAI